MAQPTEFRYETEQSGEPASVRIERQDQTGVYSVAVGGQTYTVQVDEITPDSIRFSVEGRSQHSQRALVVTDGSRRLVALEGFDGRVYTLTPANESPDSHGSRRKGSAGAGDEEVTATMPGQVVKVLVAQGEAVSRGQPLVVLEAMKMELRVTAPHDGQVARVLCESGQVIARGQVLLVLTGG